MSDSLTGHRTPETDPSLDEFLPTLREQLQDLLLFLQQPAAWGAVSRAGPPFLAVALPPAPLEERPLPNPGAILEMLGSSFPWPDPGQVRERSLAPPQPSQALEPGPLWVVGGFTGPRLASAPAAGEGFYLHLVVWVPSRQLGTVRAIFRRCLQRMDDAARIWNHVRQLERHAALGRLLAILAHEIRNDLTTIRASLQLARQEAGPTLSPLLERVIREVDQSAEFMELLLRSASPRPETPRPVELVTLVRETLTVYRGLCHAQGVGVRASYPEERLWVVASPPMLRHALGNLVRNALDAMPKGGTLRVSVRQRDPDRVEVVVEDSGPGLSAEARQHLFQPFVTLRPGGTGLGLALARQIAVAHGGDVTAESRPGEGAAFILALPLAPGPRDPHTE